VSAPLGPFPSSAAKHARKEDNNARKEDAALNRDQEHHREANDPRIDLARRPRAISDPLHELTSLRSPRWRLASVE
ncbi:MAG: hypothetical protein N2C14_19360, partial [Planctomycetales bacterium]